MSTVRIQVRRGTAAQWTSIDPVLEAGEIGFESDTNKFKFGNGTDDWSLLTYAAPGYTDFQNTLDDYLAVGLRGTANGVAALDSSKNVIVPGASIIVEGATDNTNETTLTVVDPTADRTITFQDATGTVVLRDSTDTLTNKSISLGSNTITSTLAQLNTAVSDADVASLAGTETLTNKTLTSPVINTPTGITKTDVGLANVDNTTDANKPVSTAAQTALDLKAPLANPTFTGTVTLPGAPGSANEAATKAYVDNITAGLNFHAAVRVATTANITLSGEQTIDGVSIVSGDRVLVKDQTTQTQNGIYVASASSWSRATDADNTPSGEIAYGDFVFVQSGTGNGGYGFTMTTTGTITLGTSNINWTQFNAGQSVIASNGLIETSAGVFAIDTSVVADLSTAQTLTNKTLTSPTINTPTGITKSDVGLANVDNTSDVNKPVSTATQTALDAKLASATAASTYAPLASPTLTGVPTAPTASGNTNTTQIATTAYTDTALSTHNSDTTDVHGITNTADLATKSYADGKASDAQTNAVTAAGIAAASAIATAVTNHENDTTNVHGIADTSVLTTASNTQTLTGKTLTSPKINEDVALTATATELNYVDGVTSAIQTQIDSKASTSHAHAISDVTNLQTSLDAKAALAGATFTGAVVLAANPSTALGAATKQYVDSLAEGLHIHASVVAATTANITLATAVENGDTLDGVTLATGNRILVKNQSTASENGIYVVEASGAPSRAADFDTPAEIDGGDFVFVTGGTVNDNTGWVQTNIVGTVGTDAIAFNQFAGAGTVTAGTNISVTGNQVSVINNPTFSGVVTASASGVAFSDGTQTKEGVPSQTTIIQKTAAYTLSSLTERDDLIEVSHTGGSAVDITIPTDATLNFPIGTSIDVLRTNTGGVRIVAEAGATVNSTPGAFLRAQWSSATLFKRAANTWVLIGDLATA